MKQIITFFSITIMAAMLFTNSCSDRQDITTVYHAPPPVPRTYTADIKPFLDASCAASCHSAALRLGNYDLSSYSGVLGNGSDATPNAIAGDPNSKLILQLAAGHQGVSLENQGMIYDWVVLDSLQEN